MLNFFSMLQFLLLGLLLLSSAVFAQVTSFNTDGRNYTKEDNKWFSTNTRTGERFLVNTRSITVKLKNEESKEDMLKLTESMKIKVKRENILGYIDLELLENSSFIEAHNALEKTDLFDLVEINTFGEMLGTPNDQYYSYQHYLNHPTRPDINAPQGWNFATNFGAGVIIAVIDEGVNFNHSDLTASKWGTGGWDYVDDPEDSVPLPNIPNEDHGTNVAGIAAACTNNNTIGVAGVAGGWGSQGAQIMALRVIEHKSTPPSIIYSDAVDDAIIYAALNGAKIINMSFKVDELSAIKDALSFAYNTRGCLLVAAAGNQYQATQPYFPARDNAVMAVAGIDWSWDHFGNTGSQIEIAAPAQDIYSTGYSSLYIFFSGTSQAAPQVSGAAALIWSDYPELTNFDLRNHLKNTAYSGFTQYSANEFGKGLLDLEWTLFIASLLPPKPTGISIYAPLGNHPVISWNAVQDADHYIIYRSEYGKRFQLYQATTTTNTSWTDNAVTAANPHYYESYYYRVTAVDADGIESPVSDEVSCASAQIWKNNSPYRGSAIHEFKLYENYPNPFNPSTTIKYSLREAGLVQIKVFDILGREVAEIVNEFKEPGEYSVTFDASSSGGGLASGIYYYRIDAGKFLQTKKLVLAK